MTQLVTSEKLITETDSRLQLGPIFRYRWRVLLVALGLSLVLLYLAAPYLLWAYNIYRAGRIMDTALVWPADQKVDRLPELRDPNAGARALGHISAAIRWRPGNAQAYRFAGYIYAARHDWAAAASEAERAYAVAPRNQLIMWERVLVYDQLSKRAVTQGDMQPRLRQALQESGYDPQRAILLGDAAYQSGHFATAADYFRRSLLLLPARPFDLVYRAAVTAALSGDPAAPQLIAEAQAHDSSFTIQQVSDSLVMAGTSLRWMTVLNAKQTYGTPLPRVDPLSTAGVMQWSGQAQVLIKVATADTYRFEMRLRNGRPAPIDMVMGVDGQQRQSVRLERNDNLWGTVSMSVSLSAGIHSLDVWFLNNDIVDGLDRDAVIEWVRLGRGALSAAQAIDFGDEARLNYNYAEAATKYQQALKLDARRPFDLLFRAALMAALSGDPAAPDLFAEVQARDPTFAIPRVERRVRIGGDSLRWVTPIGDSVTFGTPVVRYGASGTIGVLSWSGQAAAVIKVEHSGVYRVQVRAQHSQPAPVDVVLGIDGRAISQWKLDLGDDSWQTLSISLELAAGTHTVDYWFLNNDLIDGVDRDARLEWIDVEAETP